MSTVSIAVVMRWRWQTKRGRAPLEVPQDQLEARVVSTTIILAGGAAAARMVTRHCLTAKHLFTSAIRPHRGRNSRPTALGYHLDHLAPGFSMLAGWPPQPSAGCIRPVTIWMIPAGRMMRGHLSYTGPCDHRGQAGHVVASQYRYSRSRARTTGGTLPC